MTKSAKQDTSKGPVQATAAESAATTDADSAKPAAANRQAADEPETTGKRQDEAKHDHDHADQPDLDDVKAKFREALDRKRQVHAEGQGKGAHEAGKVNGAHGPAASRRNFRRKSG